MKKWQIILSALSAVSIGVGLVVTTSIIANNLAKENTDDINTDDIIFLDDLVCVRNSMISSVYYYFEYGIPVINIYMVGYNLAEGIYSQRGDTAEQWANALRPYGWIK